MSIPTWKQELGAQIPQDLGREIDIYETQLELRRQGKLDEKIFGETRLRRGVYGQRYDNGHRHDGSESRTLAYPSAALTKGPQTLWDAPGMQRIKIPFGSVSPDQLDVLAELAEEYSTGVLHVTTRQDFQLHYVHIEDTPDVMRRLAAVGITTREACGNSVRNVTACPLAGVCSGETFDVTRYARALAYFLLGHPDAQDFGRKFKVAFSGCKDEPCALTTFHDLGFIARTRTEDGRTRRGFELYVGGGLGAVPHPAKLFDPFLPEEELLPIAQAICRVFARLGEKKTRARARLKFLVGKLGIDELRRLVLEEREKLPEDPRWTEYLNVREGDGELATTPLVSLDAETEIDAPDVPPGFDAWKATNVRPQRQEGYAVAVVTLPLGDISAHQARALADVARRFGPFGKSSGDTLRTTVDQNFVLRYVAEVNLPKLFTALDSIGLAQPGAGTIVDVTACPGTDTCKLGIASSRGLASELRNRLLAQDLASDTAVKDLHIKVSGCFNSCGQHHVADVGFYGVSRQFDGRTVPHFQVVLGGQWTENAKSFGLAIGAVPSKRIPEVVDRLTDLYRREAHSGQTFSALIRSMGKAKVRALLDDLIAVPAYEEDSSLYSDWGDPREFTIGDMGRGECAGEVISRFAFEVAASERRVFEAQLQLERGNAHGAAGGAYDAMVSAAAALVHTQNTDVNGDPLRIVDEFKSRFYDTKLFFDRFAGGKFAHYLFRAHKEILDDVSADAAHHLIEEAQLFIEATHACYGRMVKD